VCRYLSILPPKRWSQAMKLVFPVWYTQSKQHSFMSKLSHQEPKVLIGLLEKVRWYSKYFSIGSASYTINYSWEWSACLACLQKCRRPQTECSGMTMPCSFHTRNSPRMELWCFHALSHTVWFLPPYADEGWSARSSGLEYLLDEGAHLMTSKNVQNNL
jgi:hypothetical protein